MQLREALLQALRSVLDPEAPAPWEGARVQGLLAQLPDPTDEGDAEALLLLQEVRERLLAESRVSGRESKRAQQHKGRLEQAAAAVEDVMRRRLEARQRETGSASVVTPRGILRLKSTGQARVRGPEDPNAWPWGWLKPGTPTPDKNKAARELQEMAARGEDLPEGFELETPDYLILE